MINLRNMVIAIVPLKKLDHLISGPFETQPFFDYLKFQVPTVFKSPSEKRTTKSPLFEWFHYSKGRL